MATTLWFNGHGLWLAGKNGVTGCEDLRAVLPQGRPHGEVKLRSKGRFADFKDVVGVTILRPDCWLLEVNEGGSTREIAYNPKHDDRLTLRGGLDDNFKLFS